MTSFSTASQFREWEAGAELGDGEAQFQLGLAYASGTHGVAKNPKKAFQYLADAARQGHPSALGNMCKELPQAAQCYLKSATLGNAEAQLLVGVFMLYGMGLPQDVGEGLRWLRLSAEQGFVLAQCELGHRYKLTESEGGLGVDYALAREWTLKAAEQGLDKAEFNMGVLYANGSGVEKNMDTAIEWYRKAAARGMVDAQYDLGRALMCRKATNADIDEAMSLFHQLAESGHDPSRVLLAAIAALSQSSFSSSEEMNRAVTWSIDNIYPELERICGYSVTPADTFRPAAQSGDPEAQFKLGNALICTPHASPATIAEAIEWIRKAAEQNYQKAQSSLCDFYSTGFHVPEDEKVSLYWAERAALNGDASCAYRVGLELSTAAKTEKERAAAFRWFKLSADGGDTMGMLAVGESLVEARGVERDLEAGMKMFINGFYQSVRPEPIFKSNFADDVVPVIVEHFAMNLLHWKESTCQKCFEIFQRWEREKHDKHAQFGLAMALFYGRGCPVDRDQALHWCIQAHQQGQPRATTVLPAMYLSRRRDAQAKQESDDDEEE